MISILLLASEPTDASRLRLGEELREIHEKLQLSRFRESFSLHQRMSVRPTDFSQALLDIEPQIVHFCGHGFSTGELCFEGNSGKIQPVQPDALAALFEQFSNQVMCVILNACYSESQARAIAQHISYVIGMRREIGDRAAIAFAVGFYQALGAKRTVEEAYKLGCVQIRLQGIAEHLTPVLLKKPDSSNSITFNSVTSESQIVRRVAYYRLNAEAEAMLTFAQATPDIEIMETEGIPPTKYVLKFLMEGVTGIDRNGKPQIAKEHIVEIVLPEDFLRSMPPARFYTPMFHPNVWDSGGVCLGWFQIPYRLPDLCIHIARMIDYQVFDTCAPSNLAAAKWADEHQDLFPLKGWQP